MDSPIKHRGTTSERQIRQNRELRTVNTNRIALVLGATGSVGREVVRALLARGWRVRALHRSPETAASCFSGLPVEWLQGDASKRQMLSTPRGTPASFFTE